MISIKILDLILKTFELLGLWKFHEFMFVPQFASEVYQQVIYNFILTRFIQNNRA